MNEIWKHPTIRPLPIEPEYLLSLDGVWKFTHTPGANFYAADHNLIGWQDLAVPSQVDHPDPTEYAYAKDVLIPAEWDGRKVIIRFDGANCLARVFVNGQFAKQHYGGFNAWDCDITPYVKAGEAARITVGIENRPREMNSFHVGGLIRSVTMFSVPVNHLTRLHAETKWDAQYVNSTLRVLGEATSAGKVTFSMKAPCGCEIALGEVAVPEGPFEASFAVEKPLPWDSEHPNLYTLVAVYSVGGEAVQTLARRFGFREVERRGSQVYVNGQEIKLHGVNRHDTHPVTKRAITHELVEADVKLFKEANVNFIRTSHYAPRPDFLDLCDEYGIYVEDESAAFVGQNGYYTNNNPDFTARYLEPLADMVERDRSHPCVIIWSLANESYWGENFDLCHKYVKKEDPSRLTIFSYPITMREDDEMTDIWSMHYAGWDQHPTALVDSFNRSCHDGMEIPVLHDESTHVPCYDKPDQRRDPGVRDFWSETMKQFWDRLWSTKGALGCAIWAGLDEGNERHFVPWGLIDGWRRKKPEHFIVKKAYSPIHLEQDPCCDGAGGIKLVVTNRFNHTCLSEVALIWTAGDESGEFLLPAAAPRETVEVSVPAAYENGKKLRIAFRDAQSLIVDEYEWVLGYEAAPVPAPVAGCPEITETADEVVLTGDGVEVVFDKKTGLISRALADGKLVLTGGPAIQLTGLDLAPWALEKFAVEKGDGAAVVTSIGAYGKVKVAFTIEIDKTGLMRTAYEFVDMPYPSPRLLAMRIGDDTDVGGYEEVGVYFTVPGELDQLSWKKQSYFSAYPDWHIGREEGTTPRFSGVTQTPGVKPEHDWQLDEKDFGIFGAYDPGCRGTVDFRSMKSYIERATLGNGEAGFTVLSDRSDSVRMEVTFAPDAIVEDTDPRVKYTGSWKRMKNAYRSNNGTETWSNVAGDTASLTFTGTGVIWVGALDILYGYSKVYIDGKCVGDNLFQGSIHFSEVPGKARGYEKDYKYPVYSVSGLPYGEHTITIEVKGVKHPGCFDCFVVIDRFIVLGEGCFGDTKFIIDKEWNYPELAWGCYCKEPVKVATGYKGFVTTKIK